MVLIYQCLWVYLNNFHACITYINFENAKGEGTTAWCLMSMLNGSDLIAYVCLFVRFLVCRI